MKKILLVVVFLVPIFLIIILIKTLLFESRQTSPTEKRKEFAVDSSALLRLSEAIQIKTISYDYDSLTDYSHFDTLIQFLKKSYPLSFEKLEVNIINNFSLLMRWKGRDSSRKPAIFYAHLDVVPADSNHSWSHTPFGGVMDKKFLYGRGAIDNKGSVIAILESVEKLVTAEFLPYGDIYLAFGHDEEASGRKGARKIAEELERRGVKASFLLDEGGLVAIDMVPFVKPPVALVFTSEKGYMTLNLRVRSTGGHSSYPSAETPIDILAKAIQTLHSNPFESRLTHSVDEFMNYTGPEMKWPYKMLFANRWIFEGIILKEYAKIPSAVAMLRTTSVATVINGGEKENAIPSEVFAKVNFRLLPGDESAAVIQRVEKLINDKRVEVTLLGVAEEASPVSSTQSEAFELIQSSIKNVFPDAVLAPSLLIAQTDSRHFKKVTENIYRFVPIRMNDEILDGMHGADEKIGIPEFMEAIAFYSDLLRKL